MAKYLDDAGVQQLWNKCKETFELKGSGGEAKYTHNIILKETNSSGSRGTVVSFQLKNDVSTSYTSVADINSALRTKGYTSRYLTLHANGKYRSSSLSYVIIAIFSNSTTQIGVRGCDIASNSNGIANYEINISNMSIEQDVVEG